MNLPAATATTADAVSTLLDADRLSELLDQPVRAGRLRIKPNVSVLVSLTDRSTGLTSGWARLLWPVSHSKAAQAERLAASLGLDQAPVTRGADGDLLLQSGPVHTDPKLAEPMAGGAGALEGRGRPALQPLTASRAARRLHGAADTYSAR